MQTLALSVLSRSLCSRRRNLTFPRWSQTQRRPATGQSIPCAVCTTVLALDVLFRLTQANPRYRSSALIPPHWHDGTPGSSSGSTLRNRHVAPVRDLATRMQLVALANPEQYDARSRQEPLDAPIVSRSHAPTSSLGRSGRIDAPGLAPVASTLPNWTPGCGRHLCPLGRRSVPVRDVGSEARCGVRNPRRVPPDPNQRAGRAVL